VLTHVAVAAAIGMNAVQYNTQLQTCQLRSNSTHEIRHLHYSEQQVAESTKHLFFRFKSHPNRNNNGKKTVTTTDLFLGAVRDGL
jgi:Na+/phosphate symporter